MSVQYVCENAVKCERKTKCAAATPHECSTHCAPKLCSIGLVSKCCPVAPVIDPDVAMAREYAESNTMNGTVVLGYELNTLLLRLADKVDGKA